MTWRLHYFALEFRDATFVARHTFSCACDAEEGARMSARLSGGAIALQVWGDSKTDEWDEAEVLCRIGLTPWIDLDWSVKRVA